MDDDTWSTSFELLKQSSLALNNVERVLSDFETYRNLNEVIFPSNVKKQLKNTARNMIDINKFLARATDIFEFSRSSLKDELLENVISLLKSFKKRLENCSSMMLYLMRTNKYKKKKFAHAVEKLFNQISRIRRSKYFLAIMEYKIEYYSLESVDHRVQPEEGLEHYVDVSSCFDLEDENLNNIIKNLLSPLKDAFFMLNGRLIFKCPYSIPAYSAILGPSLMGKTQLSFILARKMPVFYFNFSDTLMSQNIYYYFGPLKDLISDFLNSDRVTLNRIKKPNQEAIGSNNIFDHKTTKLYTIGFIWELIKYSLNFEDEFSNGGWFNHYLAGRTFPIECLSLAEYYISIGNNIIIFNSYYNFLAKLLDITPNFKIPVIFIDELPKEFLKEIKLLRNIVRCMFLPCVLSSTNSMVCNMFNSKSTTSKSFNLWVNAIIRLLKANLAAIMKRVKVASLGCKLVQYVDANFNLVANTGQNISLLQSLRIKCDPNNRDLLIKIWNFIKSQALTCLQDTAFHAFNLFVQQLEEFSDLNLDSRKLWLNICDQLLNTFHHRKVLAFSEEGNYFSLRMFLTNRKFGSITNSQGPVVSTLETIESSEEQVRNSIDHHFYYFGDESDSENVLVFGCNGKLLFLNNEPYRMRSHFKSFEADFLTSMSLWKTPGISDDSVASIVQASILNNSGTLADPSARKNDSNTQETMTYWSVASSSHQDYHGNTNGNLFLKLFTENLQCNIGSYHPKLDTESLSTKLTSFLGSVTVPYLVPYTPSASFSDSLEGICNLGLCYRCPNATGYGVGFEIFKNHRKSFSFIECKYTDTVKTLNEIAPYIDRARTTANVLTIIVSYGMHSVFKTAERLDLPSTDNGFNLNFYSIFFEESNLTSKTLYECEDEPDGIVILVETNFKVPKI